MYFVYKLIVNLNNFMEINCYNDYNEHNLCLKNNLNC